MSSFNVPVADANYEFRMRLLEAEAEQHLAAGIHNLHYPALNHQGFFYQPYVNANANAAQQQQQEQPQQQPIEDLYQPLGVGANAVDDPLDRMILTEDERNLAIQIKEVIAATPEVDPVSDFMCAQLAIVEGDNTEGALERMHQLQCFREEYGIMDTAQDGRRCFAEYLKLFPEFHLCFAENQDSGKQSVMVYDNTKFDGKQLRTEENIRSWLGGTYYTAVAFCPDFEAIRTGAVLVCECEGYEFQLSMSLHKNLKRVWSEVANVYPMIFQKIKYFNSGTAMTLVVSMLKPFLPKGLRSKIEFGCQFPQRLDQLYLVPTVEEANQRLLRRVEATLGKRFENERNFRL